MVPPPSLYSSGMHVTDSTKTPSTGPLDVLFYIGLGVIAILLIWFTGYLCMKIYVIIKQDPAVSARNMGRWNVFNCCLRRQVGMTQDKVITRDGVLVPEWAVAYDTFVHSPESDGPATPGEHFPRGLGIDFGEMDCDVKAAEEDRIFSVPRLAGSVELTRQQCRNPEAGRDSASAASSCKFNLK